MPESPIGSFSFVLSDSGTAQQREHRLVFDCDPLDRILKCKLDQVIFYDLPC